MKNTKVVLINTAFPEMDQLAAGLSEAGLLSCYVRPYANKGRLWERSLSAFPGLGGVYRRTFGRRKLTWGLDASLVKEVGVFLDFLGSLIIRVSPTVSSTAAGIGTRILAIRNQVVAQAGVRYISDNSGVVASWGCAEPSFKRVKQDGGTCILNYSFAHHRFAQQFLMQEIQREPEFADSLNGHDWSEPFVDQLDVEIELADRILIGSSFVRDSFTVEGIPAEKLVVIPYGADASLFEPMDSQSRTDGQFNILFVGQITQRKGLSYLLHAYERFAGPDTSLTLVGQIQGNGSCLLPYRKLFKHISHIPRQNLREIYREAHVFLFPTLVEGMPLVVLEAMASGLPVVTTPNGPGDIVRDGIDGFLVPPRDVDAIVEKLEYLRVNSERRREMGRNARRRALEFTWEAYRSKVVQEVGEWIVYGT